MDRLFKKRIHREIVLYGLIGGASAATDALIFWLLSKWMNPFLANCISVTVGMTMSFFLNTFVNFKVRDRLPARAVSFYIVGVAGLGLSSLLLYIGKDMLLMDQLLVKIVSIVFVAAFQFVLNKFITFRQGKGDNA